MDLTEGIRAERARYAERMGEITAELKRLGPLEEELATLAAADRELEAVEERFTKLETGAAPPPPPKPQSVKEKVAAYLEKVGEVRGTSKLARAAGTSQRGAYDAVVELEGEGAVELKRSDTKGTPMVITWLGKPAAKSKTRAKPKIVRNRTAQLPKGETERRIREFLKANPRVEGMTAIATGANVPKGSISGTLVKLERERLVRIERVGSGNRKSVIIHYAEPEVSNNGASSAQEATV
jgi:DNA-binding phage protein